MKLKRFFSAFLAAALLAGTVPAALAADIDSHWSKPYVTSLHELGIINPSASTGNYTPEASVTRWEFMRYINRAFDFTEKASISFSDVKSSDMYYETIQIAVKHGYINGTGNNKMDPEGTLTREQAATILGRLHKYAPTASASKLDMFTDKSKISSYATSYVAEAVSQGYINGYTDGTFKPQGNLKRGEIAKILYFYLGSVARRIRQAVHCRSLPRRHEERHHLGGLHAVRRDHRGQSLHHRGRALRQRQPEQRHRQGRYHRRRRQRHARRRDRDEPHRLQPDGHQADRDRDRLDQYRHRRGAVLRLAL